MQDYYRRNDHYAYSGVGGGGFSPDDNARYDRIIDAVDPGADGLILDYGCGQGGLSHAVGSAAYPLPASSRGPAIGTSPVNRVFGCMRPGKTSLRIIRPIEFMPSCFHTCWSTCWNPATRFGRWPPMRGMRGSTPRFPTPVPIFRRKPCTGRISISSTFVTSAGRISWNSPNGPALKRTRWIRCRFRMT